MVEDGIDGFIVPERDSDALGFAIRRLVSDRDLRESPRRPFWGQRGNSLPLKSAITVKMARPPHNSRL
jgi:hypothetical protein